MSPTRWDLVVVGGGPAGLATAIHAALRGRSAVVLEPQPGTIDKACGEGLMPPAVAALAAMGVHPATSHPFTGVRYVRDGVHATAHFRTGPGLGVRRLALHQALLARALDLGVELRQARVDTVHQDGDGVEAGGLRGRYLAAADGLHSPIRRQLGLDLPPLRPTRKGIRQHFATAPWSDLVEVHWADEAEAYVTPVAPDLVGLAFLFRSSPPGDGPPYHRLLELFPDLRARLGQPASTIRGAGPFEQRVRSRVAGRVLLVGDAAGYLDPLTGEGVRLALDGAAALVDAVVQDRPEAYEASWRRITRRYWWMTDGLLRLTRPRWARRALVPVLKRVPGVMAAAVNGLAA